MTKKVRLDRPKELKKVPVPDDCNCYFGENRVSRETGKAHLQKSHDDWCPVYERNLILKAHEAERIAQESEMQLALPDAVAEAYAAETATKARKKANKLTNKLAKLAES